MKRKSTEKDMYALELIRVESTLLLKKKNCTIKIVDTRIPYNAGTFF